MKATSRKEFLHNKQIDENIVPTLVTFTLSAFSKGAIYHITKKKKKKLLIIRDHINEHALLSPNNNYIVVYIISSYFIHNTPAYVNTP